MFFSDTKFKNKSFILNYNCQLIIIYTQQILMRTKPIYGLTHLFVAPINTVLTIIVPIWPMQKIWPCRVYTLFFWTRGIIRIIL